MLPAVQGGRNSAQQIAKWLVLNGACVQTVPGETLGCAPPDLSCSVPFLVSPVLWSTQPGLVWGLCLEWPGNNGILSIISSSLLLSDYSFCCSLSPLASVLQEKQVCGTCLLNLSPCPPSHPPHISVSFWSGLILLCVVDFWSSKYICQLYAI